MTKVSLLQLLPTIAISTEACIIIHTVVGTVECDHESYRTFLAGIFSSRYILKVHYVGLNQLNAPLLSLTFPNVY